MSRPSAEGRESLMPLAASAGTPTLFVHVGPHKTGTTYLQHRLVTDRDLLASEAGLLYPRTAQDYLWGHHSLREAFTSPAEHARQLALLVEELEGWNAGLISSERLSRLSESGFDSLRRAFPDHRIVVLAYLRVRSELVVSYWAETVKHGARISLPRFVAQLLDDPMASPILNQRMLLDTLSNVFGREDLRVLLYRRDVELYEELLRTVVGSTAFLARSEGKPEIVNPTLSLHDTECIRLLSSAAHTRGLSSATQITGAFLAALGNPTLEDDLLAFRAAFREHAALLDLSNLDEAFRALDVELFSAYAGNLRGSATTARYPESSVREVRCLPDSASSGREHLAAIVERILDRILSAGGSIATSAANAR